MNAVTTTKQLTPLQEVCTNIERMAPQFEQALIGTGVSKERFVRTVLQGIQSHRDKDKLAKAKRSTLYLACQKAAQDGLVLDGREAALSVFGDEVVYMPMVQGLVKLARNSGEIANIASEVVYSKDKFTYRPGVDEQPVHEPDWFADDRGHPVGVWATVTLKSGETVVAVAPKKKIMQVAAKSKNGYQYDPDKGPFFDEWWKKTAIRNVLKYAPKSTQLQRAMDAEGSAFDFDEPQRPTIDVPAHDPAPNYEDQSQDPADQGRSTEPKQTRAARAVKAQATKPQPDSFGPPKGAVASESGDDANMVRQTPHDPETGEVIEDVEYSTVEGEDEVPI